MSDQDHDEQVPLAQNNHAMRRLVTVFLATIGLTLGIASPAAADSRGGTINCTANSSSWPVLTHSTTGATSVKFTATGSKVTTIPYTTGGTYNSVAPWMGTSVSYTITATIILTRSEWCAPN